MGREIRRVPPDWQHPREICHHSPWAGGCDDAKAHGGKCYKPLMDGSYSQRAREWMDECLAWEAGVHPEATEYKGKYPFFWEWEGGPPRPEDYRPDWPDETATAYQFYENVSEGTPLSPVVATLEALVDWLATAGGYSRAAAEAFAKDGYAPSMIYSPEIGLMDGVSALEFLKRPGYSPKE